MGIETPNAAEGALKMLAVEERHVPLRGLKPSFARLRLNSFAVEERHFPLRGLKLVFSGGAFPFVVS